VASEVNSSKFTEKSLRGKPLFERLITQSPPCVFGMRLQPSEKEFLVMQRELPVAMSEGMTLKAGWKTSNPAGHVPLAEERLQLNAELDKAKGGNTHSQFSTEPRVLPRQHESGALKRVLRAC